MLDPRNSLIFEICPHDFGDPTQNLCDGECTRDCQHGYPEGVPVIDAFCRVIADGGFSTYDALRKSLHQQAEAFGGIQQTSPTKKPKRKNPESDPQPQLSLFE